jgi:hypothetical protein
MSLMPHSQRGTCRISTSGKGTLLVLSGRLWWQLWRFERFSCALEARYDAMLHKRLRDSEATVEVEWNELLRSYEMLMAYGQTLMAHVDAALQSYVRRMPVLPTWPQLN